MPIHFTPFTGGLLLINLITFAAYGYDKFCARRGAWRVPEIRLLLLAAVGAAWEPCWPCSCSGTRRSI